MISCLNPVTASVDNPEDFVRLAARNGFTGLDHGADYWAAWAKRTSVNHILEFCHEHGCSVAHGGLPVDFRGDDAVFEADLVRFPAICEVHKTFGVRGMATWITPATKDDVQELRAKYIRRLKKVTAILASFDLMLGLEFVGPATSRREGNPFIYTMQGMLDLCADIDGEHCGLLLDSYHWYTSHGTTKDIVVLNQHQIVHVHINDAYPDPIDELQDMHRLLPGEGAIDLNAFLTSLRQIGYNGPVAVETFSDELRRIGPEESAKRAGAAMSQIMVPFLSL